MPITKYYTYADIFRSQLLTLMYHFLYYCSSINYLLYILHNWSEKLQFPSSDPSATEPFKFRLFAMSVHLNCLLVLVRRNRRDKRRMYQAVVGFCLLSDRTEFCKN